MLKLLPSLVATGYTREALEALFYWDSVTAKRLVGAAKIIGGFAARDAASPSRRGRCLLGVAKALVAVNGKDTNFYRLPTDSGRLAIYGGQQPGESAGAMLRWAAENPVSLCSHLGLSRARAATAGSLLFFAPGRCGFSSRSGHVEIAVSSRLACSDHCRRRSGACDPDLVLAPVLGCEGPFTR